MTSPERSTRAAALQEPGVETSGNEAEMSQTVPVDDSSSSTKSPKFRSSTKRKKSEIPTPQPQLAHTRRRTVPGKSRGAISSAKTGAVADGAEDDSADHNDLASEQRHLIDENTTTLGRFADPRTPPNRPRLLTENGFLTIVPVSEGSPSDQGSSERPGDLPKEGLMFGDWLPGHGSRDNNASSLGPRHEHQDGSPSVRIIRERPRDSRKKGIEFGDWLPGQGPQTNDAWCLAPRHDHQEDESVGARNGGPRPWEL